MTTTLARPYPTRAQADTMFRSAVPAFDPEGIISEYLAFEFHRFKQDQFFTLNGDLTERLKILYWYLAGYGPHRGLPLPLSKKQIDFLNADAPIIGLGVKISVAAYSFIINELGPDYNLRSESTVREALYWWCFDKSARFTHGGELITPSQVKALTHIEGMDVGQKYPINYAMRRHHELDPSLASLNLAYASDRAALTVALLLRCVEKPYLLQFIPPPSIIDLFAVAKRGETSNFEKLVARVFETLTSPETAAADAAAFGAQLEARLSHAGYSLTRPGRPASRGAGHSGLSYTHDPEIEPGLEPGVAVIGPTRATSGLGQATRLSIDVLDHAGLAPAALDFGLDNPAPVGFTSLVKAPKLRVPRRINLLHLNAESIPLVFAFKNKAIYDRSYNIGYFFWELNEIPKCHRLALEMLDEIWVSSEYNREIYERFATIPVRNVGMAVEPLPEAVALPRSDFGIGDDDFVFLATFDSFSFIERKNPLGVLAAFQQAFPAGSGENVVLILKTQNRGRVGDPHQVRIWQTIDAIIERDPRIRLVDRTMSYRDLLGFKRACDCYVSLHRSEGWGFGMIEAMQLGLPVITTGYSGNMEFCSPETARLVDYDLIPLMPAEYIFVERGSVWADPSVASAAAAMREVFTRPDEAKARAAAASRRVETDFGIGSIAKRYRARLTEIEAIIDRETGSPG